MPLRKLIEPYEKEVEVIKRIRRRPHISEELKRSGLKSIREVLEHLYWTRALPIETVAELLGVSPITLRKWVAEEEITPRRFKLPEIWRPSEEELPPHSEWIDEEPFKIRYWVPDLEDYWLMGFNAGDGWLYCWKKGRRVRYAFAVSNKNKALIDKAYAIMKKHGSPFVKYMLCWTEDGVLKTRYLKGREKDRANLWEVVLHNVKLFTTASARARHRNYENLAFFLATKDRASRFTQGFADAEGTVRVEDSAIRIDNRDRRILELIEDALTKHFTINYTIEEEPRTSYIATEAGVQMYEYPIYRLGIYRMEDIAKFSAEIGFQHPEKREMLGAITKAEAPTSASSSSPPSIEILSQGNTYSTRAL